MQKNTPKQYLQETKKDEWRKNVGHEEYKNNSIIVAQIHEKNVRKISEKLQKKKKFLYKPKSTLSYGRTSRKSIKAYERWKHENPLPTNDNCPEIPVRNLLVLVHYLKAPDNNESGEILKCIRHQPSKFETFWDSPSFILKALRQCLYTRDWDNMTYFLLILLNYDKKHIPIVKNMCKIMFKYNPLIKTCGLEEQFKQLFNQTDNKLVVV